MGMFKIIYGDLITLALNGHFDVIGHGCNCFCTMGAGIAVQMKNVFECDKYPLEHKSRYGDINKLGQIDYLGRNYTKDSNIFELIIINCYTQYHYGKNHVTGTIKPIDYEALTLCLRKINHVFAGKRVGLPAIGAGLAGGDLEVIKEIMKRELDDCDVTLVLYNG